MGMRKPQCVVISLGICLLLTASLWFWLSAPTRSGPESGALEQVGVGSDLVESCKKSRVQILVYGLSVFDFQNRDRGPVRALFPNVMGHTMGLWYGSSSMGTFDWFPLEKDPEGNPLYIDNGTVEVEGAAAGQSLVVATSSLPPTWLPANAQSARGADWILPAGTIGSFNTFNVAGVKSVTKLLLRSGTVETCGLVHPPGEYEKVCRVRPSSTTVVPRAASEYMVLKFDVPCGTTEIQISTKNSEREVRKTSVNPTRPGSVVNGDDAYKFVFDLQIVNLAPLGEREVRTKHINELKPFFSGSIRDWEIVAPDCNRTGSSWECDENCESLNQPSCLSYYVNNYPKWFPLKPLASGANRPMCPFVQFP